MYGTLAGNAAGSAYYLYFQFVGILLAFTFLRQERPLARLLIGSVAGSLLLIWLPVPAAFFLDFTLFSHMLALCLTVPMVLFSFCCLFRRRSFRGIPKSSGTERKGRRAFPLAFGLTMGLWLFLLYTHTLLPDGEGALWTGQCTYGDMNMHLGFITSLARQKTFPPDYSIMPGVRLSYPFLSDSVSSCLLLFGASLRYAYAFPMIFAMAQTLLSVYLLAETVLSSLGGHSRRAALPALVLFFLNGGLGFLYFTGRPGGYGFSDIFTGFYTTPTNLVEQNIRWVNVLADMLLPQRATMFGYAVLFPFLWLLYRAAFQNRTGLFALAGIFGGALPMIHTHSFLSACVVGGAWFYLWLYQRVVPSPGVPSPRHTSGHETPETRNPRTEARPSSWPFLRLKSTEPWISGTQAHPSSRHLPRRKTSAPWFLGTFTVFMCLVQVLHKSGKLSSPALMAIGAGLFAALFFSGLALLILYVKRQGWEPLLSCWGCWTACLLLPALPQLLFWTFGQVAEGGFVRGHFNWGNQGDFYPWFYLKNIGLPLFLIAGATRTCDRRRAPLFLPPLLLWWMGELVVFTPNTYDNNKLLYPAYLLLCIGASEYGADVYSRLSREACRMRSCFLRILVFLFLFFSTISGILTLGREAVSRYQLYGASQVKLAEYIEAYTAPNAVFLTGTRHNNEIASLTGRNIVCGSDSFLYFHGLDTTERKNHLQLMYEAPLEHMELYEKYNVSYVVVSSYERSQYAVAEENIRSLFPRVFSWGDMALYQVRQP